MQNLLLSNTLPTAIGMTPRPGPSLDLNFAASKTLVDQVSGRNLVTFTRTSGGTYVDSGGVIRTATTNLLLRSEEFDQVLTWGVVGGGASISANQLTSPNGTITADKLNETNATSTFYCFQGGSFVSGLQYTFSVYAKKGERNFVALRLPSGAFGSNTDAYFNLNTGAVGTTVNSPTAFITNVGDGWYRCSITKTATTTASANFLIFVASIDGTSSYAGSANNGIYLWGAQLEQSSTVGEYIPTTSTINSAPRFDHNPTTGESLGLLVEEQRTNSIRNNTMVGAVAGTPGTVPTNWFVYVGSGTGVATSIVGTGVESGITYVDIRFNGTPSASTTWSVINEPGNVIAAATGQSWTYSAWARISAGSSANVTSPVIFFDENQGINYITGGSIATSYLTSTWQRYSATRTLSGGATIDRVNGGLRFSVTAGQAINITLRIGLPQLEQGAFATSVIPTTTAAATRSADVASISGSNFSSWYRQDEGTVFASASVTTPSYSAGVLWDIGAGGAFGSTAYCAWNGSQWTLNPLTAPLNLFSVVASSALSANASALQLNNSVIAANGLLGSVDSSCSLPSSPTTLSIGKAGWASGNFFNGTIRRCTYYPQRLANTLLQAITT